MKELGFLVLLCLMLELSSQQNRVPPGVPPQQYAQQQQQYQGHPPPPQAHMQHQVPVQQQHQVPQYQQVPMHQQQVPVQQVPIQQQHQVPPHQQQVPQYQVPPQQQQHHPQHVQHGGQPIDPQQLLNVAHMQQENKDHIKEHLEVPIDTSNMSEQELQFHYFKMHDADNNNKLDGCELIKSLIHWHEQGHHHDAAASQLPPDQTGSKIFSDNELVSLIDPILTMDDANRDGFIDYPEFVQAQHKAAATQTQQVKA